MSNQNLVLQFDSVHFGKILKKLIVFNKKEEKLQCTSFGRTTYVGGERADLEAFREKYKEQFTPKKEIMSMDNIDMYDND